MLHAGPDRRKRGVRSTRGLWQNYALFGCFPVSEPRPQRAAARPGRSGPSIKNILGVSSMHRVLVLGAGKIGSLLSGLLASSGDYEISLADANGKAAES